MRLIRPKDPEKPKWGELSAAQNRDDYVGVIDVLFGKSICLEDFLLGRSYVGLEFKDKDEKEGYFFTIYRPSVKESVMKSYHRIKGKYSDREDMSITREVFDYERGLIGFSWRRQNDEM